MIVTRAWLNEFIDIRAISNEKLYETFNSIGLEVDRIKQVEIDDRVVVGKILSCEKHPNANKLNVCKIDVGSGIRQIVCAATNVLDAEYVAVATIGAILPNNLEIKHAKLRGVESEGMLCASSELDLPSMGKGIMILDESIGKLEVGQRLNSYQKVADTIIELELTPNRGDCLCVYGVARDLSAALDIEVKPFDYKQEEKVRVGIAREAELHTEGKINANLHYQMAKVEQYKNNLLIALRLAMVNIESSDKLSAMLAYATHTTGVILRAYDSFKFRNEDNKVIIRPVVESEGSISIKGNAKVFSIVGVNQKDDALAKDSTNILLLEASYIDPDLLVESVSLAKLKTDELYYKASRGSSPDLAFGLKFLDLLFDNLTDINHYEGSLNVDVDRERESISVSAEEISSIIGMDIDLGKIVTILQKLGFDINFIGDTIAVIVPMFRHDIKNIQDIAEEILRIVGINNIKSKALYFAEQNRLNKTIDRYKVKKEFRSRAVGTLFYENVSYIFSQRSLLEKYGFSTIDEKFELKNPIAEDLNTLRSTILINLLSAVKRNVNYSRKSIPLFEIGAVFDSKREQKELISFVFSGHLDGENVRNSGKPYDINFASFVQKIGAVIGAFELLPCSSKNKLIHPYQSADIIVDGKVCGYMSKLHPSAQEDFGIPLSYIAELDFDLLLPRHVNAKPISKFQGVYKDLSIVIDKSIGYYEVAKVLNTLKLPMLKDAYPVDIYEDEKLGDKKSLTLRFFIQSMDRTLEDADIESVMNNIMSILKSSCKAELR